MKYGAMAAAAAVALFTTSAAQAAVVLSDNFNADTPQLNWPGDSVFTSTSPAGNAPQNASVDLIGAGTSYDFLPGNGYYVDLDGTTGNDNLPDAGQLTSVATFGAGTYTLTFDLAGNHRVPTEQTTDINLGSTVIASITPASYLQGFTHYSYRFTTAGGQLQFTDLGPSSQQGNLLDNVRLTAVPEPAAWAMMLMGFFGVGSVVRSRRRGVAAA